MMRRCVAGGAAAVAAAAVVLMSAATTAWAAPSRLRAGSSLRALGPVAPAAGPVPGQAPGGSPAAPSDAKSWIVVDADTGAVIGAHEEHTPRRPASVAKILTGLVALVALPPDASVPVGPDAAGMEAAKIDMKAGEVWSLQDSLHALLMVSANDAAVALADRVAGSEAGFAGDMSLALRQLGVQDGATFADPAGLDDSFSFGGGDYVSAWDMAVITRAAMSVPAFRAIVSLPQYRFAGPDGVSHVLRNHNRLLTLDHTVIGVKPGYTSQAGETLVAEATRDGRNMLAVELDDSPGNIWTGAEGLLQLGFATPVASEGADPQLPAVRLPSFESVAPPAPAAPLHRTLASSSPAQGSSSTTRSTVEAALGVAVAAVALRVATVRRRRRRRDARRARPSAGHRRSAGPRPSAGRRRSAGEKADGSVDAAVVPRGGEVVHPGEDRERGVG